MYKSCNIILHGLCFFNNDLVSCCYAPNDQINGARPPMLFHNYHGEIIPKEELFAKTNKTNVEDSFISIVSGGDLDE